jgi:hypothetical protein
VVESSRGAVPVFRPARFPGPHPRTRRARLHAPGSPRDPLVTVALAFGSAVPSPCTSRFGTPVFTGGSCPADRPRLSRCAPSPCGRLSRPRRLLRALRHDPRQQRTTRLPWAGQRRVASHVHRHPVGQVGAQLYPGSIATSTPQTSSWPLGRHQETGVGVAVHLDGVHCNPARIRQVGAGGRLTRRQALVPRVHLLALLAGPGPSDGAGPSRRGRGCSHPPVRLHGQAALSFTRTAATARRRVLSSRPVRRRLVAHLDVLPHPLVGVQLR